ncbi:MAG TPA: tetratricopeptide repeat protein [Vicinamibacterales bacterium]|nr:tetratricopeptide repeat protein [Vicinamibacterales bacterium]
MLVPLVTVIVLTAVSQSVSHERTRAEQLARAGKNAEAIELFKKVVQQDPADTEARLWIARLELRVGRAADAAAGFRSVLRDHPADVDAKIGLAQALLRKGAADEALTILIEAEPAAGQNADLFSALARAYRRTGDDRRALEYFRRARALSPDDPDILSGYEAVVLAHGHSIAFEGFRQWDPENVYTSSGLIATSVRVAPRLHLDAAVHAEERSGTLDTVAGGGFLWRMTPASNLGIHALGGPGNILLPTSDISGDIINYVAAYEWGASVRRLSFSGVDVMAISPLVAWDRGGSRLDARYTYSRVHFDEHVTAGARGAAAADSTGDHSFLVRETWRGWRRASLNVGYAYGIESFEDLTVDRVGSLGASTLSFGGRFDLPSLTMITATYEHQWRSNSTTMGRLTIGLVRFFP